MNIFNLFATKNKISCDDKKAIGNFGERAAAKHLKKSKYKIVSRNYVAFGKEIDIIAENKEYIVFCEVKTRKTDAALIEKYGRPRDAVNKEKQKHIVTVAQAYLARHKSNKKPRFDIIEVYLKNENKIVLEEIVHLTDAFRAYR
jgi:putative endonuclease